MDDPLTWIMVGGLYLFVISLEAYIKQAERPGIFPDPFWIAGMIAGVLLFLGPLAWDIIVKIYV